MLDFVNTYIFQNHDSILMYNVEKNTELQIFRKVEKCVLFENKFTNNAKRLKITAQLMATT